VLAVVVTEAMLIVNCVCVIPLKENIRKQNTKPIIFTKDFIAFFMLFIY
jgi:hypothetical protein